MDRTTVMAQVIATFPEIPQAQLDRLLSADLPDDERAIILQSWADAKIIPGPSAWVVVLQILKLASDIASLVVPIEGAVQGIITIGHG
jgi:hypothetical protein